MRSIIRAILLLCAMPNAQGQSLSGCSTIGFGNSTSFVAIALTPDDGALCVGSMRRGEPSNADLFILRMGAVGDTIWTRRIGGEASDWGQDVVIRDDNVAIISGTTRSTATSPLDYDLWVLAVDLDGELLWSTVVRTPGNDVDSWVALSPDGGCLVSATLGGTNPARLALIKLDAQGQLVWSRAMDSDGSYGSQVVAMSDGGFAVAGFRTIGDSNEDMLVLRLNADGDVLWQRAIGGPFPEFASTIAEHNDGGLLIGGNRYDPLTAQSSTVLAVLDSTGNLQWSTSYMNDLEIIPYAVMARGDGSYVVGGPVYSPTAPVGMVLMEVGDSLLSTRLYTGPDPAFSGYDMTMASDGGVWVCGSISAIGSGKIMRLDPELEVCEQCANWVPISTPGEPLTSVVVDYSFSPMGVAIPFQPTVTSGMVWTPICLSTDVATADVEVPNGSWITPGAGSLSIAPPGPASDAYAWSILDVAGRELTSGRAAGGKRTDTGFTAAGVHVLVLRSADAQHTERFVLP